MKWKYAFSYPKYVDIKRYRVYPFVGLTILALAGTGSQARLVLCRYCILCCTVPARVCPCVFRPVCFVSWLFEQYTRNDLFVFLFFAFCFVLFKYCTLHSIWYSLISGYLPVAALLLLMLVLPFLFQVRYGCFT